ncbi:DUF11 domain-containing protein [Nitriliruptoraceae bacterium ZYF776]|nr:DUF11 domain-containing protein [Profundirhabdus halotolerans]
MTTETGDPTIDPSVCGTPDVDYARFWFSPPVDGELAPAGGPGTWARFAEVALVDGVAVDAVATVVTGNITTAGRPLGFAAGDGNAVWNLPAGAVPTIRWEFFEAGTTTPAPVNAAFVVNDMDTGEFATFDLADLAGYALSQQSAVTVSEAGGLVTFAGNGNWNGDPQSRFQVQLEGITSFESTWRGFSNSGFLLSGDGSLGFDPQCWEVDKSVVSSAPIAPGNPVTYELAVTNTGVDDLTGLTMVDDLGGVLDDATFVDGSATVEPAAAGTVTVDLAAGTLTWSGDIAAGQTVFVRYEVVVDDDAVGSLINTVTGPTNCPGPDCVTVHPIEEPAPAVAIVKTADLDDVDGDGFAGVGETITYGFTVTNTGNVPLSGVAVDDPLLGEVTCAATTLAVGASTTCTAAPYVVTQDDVDAGGVVNVASVTADPPGPGTPVGDTSDEVIVPGPPHAPALEVVKSSDVADDEVVELGDTITYTFVVTNIGNVTILDVAVVDPMIGSVTCAATELAPGASTTCAADREHTITLADATEGTVVNQARAVGTTVDGGGVTAEVASDVASVSTAVAPPPTGPSPDDPSEPGDPGTVPDRPDQPGSGSLPRTGGDGLVALALFALLALGLGVALVSSTRRRGSGPAVAPS